MKTNADLIKIFRDAWFATLCLAFIGMQSCSSSRNAQALAGFPASCRLVEGMFPQTHPIQIAIDIDDDVPVLIDAKNSAPWIQDVAQSTLAIKDCEGSPKPGAAKSWQKDRNGTVWTFELDENIVGRDGHQLLVKDLINRFNSKVDSYNLLDRVSQTGAQSIAIHLTEQSNEIPEFLFAADFAIDDLSRLQSIGETIDMSGTDGRDLLASGIDGLVTMDRDVIDYAADKDEWVNVALPWIRSYVLITPFVTNTDYSSIPDDISSSFVRDVVDISSQPFQSPAWWEGLEGCGYNFEVSKSPSGGVLNIRYMAGDETGRGIAERFAVLATNEVAIPGSEELYSMFPQIGDSRYNWTAIEIKRSNTSSVETGHDFALIAAINRSSFNPCADFSSLDLAIEKHTSWKGQSYAVLPIIDVRPTLIIKKGAVNVDVDGFGRLFISNP